MINARIDHSHYYIVHLPLKNKTKNPQDKKTQAKVIVFGSKSTTANFFVRAVLCIETLLWYKYTIIYLNIS